MGLRIVYTITADCDPPPDDDFMQRNGDQLDRDLEDAVAIFLDQAGAAASVRAEARVEL